MASRILLRNGTILIHEGDKVKWLKEHDLLIEGNTISQIGEALPSTSGCREIDCTSKIISPGFVDAHHHLWQSQLKGRHGDQGFMEYMATGNLQSYNYLPEDVFWGQLTGCLESIDSGVTTVVDHAHMTYSPGHAEEGIRASVSSGIRTFFCYSLIRRIKEWSSTVKYDENVLPDWWLPTLAALAKAAPFGNGRVNLGLALDFSIPHYIAVGLWKKSAELGIQLITTHYAAHFMPNVVQILSENNLLASNILISHGNGISNSDAKTIMQNEIFICSTPETEMQMGLGDTVVFRPDVKSHTCVGVDCHSNNSSDILTQMRLALQHTRATDNATALQNGKYPSVHAKLEEAFNLGTIQGAKAINMESQIGSLAEGKKADIVIFDASSPSLVCAAQENPLAAILLHASVRDIHTMIVDGQVRKENGRLTQIEVWKGLDGEERSLLEWSDVAQRVLESRERILERTVGQDIGAALQGLNR